MKNYFQINHLQRAPLLCGVLGCGVPRCCAAVEHLLRRDALAARG
jgi:hypothetical protein